jgi:HEAT repeat protein
VTDQAAEQSGDRHAEDGDQPAVEPRLSYRLTPPTPLEATIELVIQLRGQMPSNTPAGRMAQFMAVLLPPPEPDAEGHVAWPLATGHRALGCLALAALEQGRIMLGREEIQSTVTEAMPPSQFALDEESDAGLTRDDSKAARDEEEHRTLQVVDCCRALTAASAPIRAWGNRRYLFAHPIVAAYVAARHLASDADAEGGATILAHADDPAWMPVWRFYMGLALVEPLVQHLLGGPDDLFLNRLWMAAVALMAAPPGRAAWREALMTRLARLLMNARLPELLRDRALVALIDSGDAGVGLLLKQAIRHGDPYLRAGGALGLGVLGREQDLPLIEAALNDDYLEVRLAAISALGRLSMIGSEPALELIVTAMIEAEDEAQRAAAETLADLSPAGHAVLRDGAKDPDLIVRRAAVYGLAAVNEPWVREILESMQQDDEWLVRNAAIEALAGMGFGDDEEAPSLELTLPKAEAETWLIAWAAERGEGTGVGEAALNTLARALSEGDVTIRQMAVETLGRVADPRTVDTLRQSLRDPEPAVREMALLALDEVSRRHDLTISVR